MRCEGCGTTMVAQRPAEADETELTKWKCPRCGSWCLAEADDVVMAAWLLEGREWPR